MDNVRENGSANDPRTKAQAKGCIQIGDLLIFAFGSFIMFAKTADILTAFAPTDWFGLDPYYYGLAAALLIEGFLVWRKVKSWLVPPENFVEWGTDIITTMTPFILSLTAQVIDGYVTTGLIATMDNQQKQMITTVVAALIAIPLFLDIVKTAVENAPAGIFDNIKEGGNLGLGIFGLFKKQKRPVPTATFAQTTPPPPTVIKQNGKTKVEQPNP